MGRRFGEVFFHGLEVPREVERCLRAQENPEEDPALAAFLEEAGVRFLDPEDGPSLLTGDYLTEEDLADPDIRSNVEATAELFARIAWLFEDDDGQLFGFWIDDEGALPARAEVVSYDTEGCFHSWGVAGLGDLLAEAGSLWEEDRYGRLADEAVALGLSVLHPEQKALYEAADSGLDIETMHDDLYEARRASRGPGSEP